MYGGFISAILKWGVTFLDTLFMDMNLLSGNSISTFIVALADLTSVRQTRDESVSDYFK
jgi:hypothetical protein